MPVAAAVNDCWSMDFLSDSLTDNRALRVFAAVDDHSRRCVALEFDVSLPGERVTRILDRAIEEYGKPRAIRTDTGPEVVSKPSTCGPTSIVSNITSSARAQEELIVHELEAQDPQALEV